MGLVVYCAVSFGQQSNLHNAIKAQNDDLYPSKPIVSRYHNDWTQRHYAKRIEMFKKSPLKFGEIVFVGNSITEQGHDWSERFDQLHIRNRGIAGDVSDGVLKRLDELIFYKPEAIFLLIGVNDLFNIHHENDSGRNLRYDLIVPSVNFIADNILEIAKQIDRKTPETKIFVRTVLPTRRNYLKQDILLLNDVIKENEKLGFYTVTDLYTLFVDENGDLKKELTTDGVHLNEAGYVKWVNYEKELVKGLK